MTPKELDLQSDIKIDKWVDINSEEYSYMDPDKKTSKYFMKIGLEGGFLFIDTSGRLWGKGSIPGKFYPFHFEYGNKLIGFRLAKKAAN